MQQSRGIQNVYWFTFLLAAAFLTGCSEPLPDETRLRQAVTDMEKATEARQPGPILDYLADDFLGNETYRKANIRGMLLVQFRQNPHIHVYLRIAALSVQQAQAHLQCQLILAGRDQKLVPERGRVMVIDSDWQKRDGEWRVVRATWKDPLLQP